MLDSCLSPWRQWVTIASCPGNSSPSYRLERENLYHFSLANELQVCTKIYSSSHYVISVSRCDWHILDRCCYLGNAVNHFPIRILCDECHSWWSGDGQYGHSQPTECCKNISRKMCLLKSYCLSFKFLRLSLSEKNQNRKWSSKRQLCRTLVSSITRNLRASCGLRTCFFTKGNLSVVKFIHRKWYQFISVWS